MPSALRAQRGGERALATEWDYTPTPIIDFPMFARQMQWRNAPMLFNRAEKAFVPFAWREWRITAGFGARPFSRLE